VSDDPNDSVVYHAMRWAAQLWTNNTKLSVTVIPDMPHNVRDSAPGRAAFVGYLTG
jgi:hypothetical protein